MKLFLSSTSLPGKLKEKFYLFVGKPAEEISVALFENAADIYPPEKRGFVERNYQELQEANLKITKLSLKDYIDQPAALQEALSSFDVIWFGGGNTFYLRYMMKISGFDQIAHSLLGQGVIYAGGSAGAIVAGPILNHFDAIDEPNQATEVIWQGLGLIDFIPLPHWNTPKFQSGLEKLRDDLLPYNKELAIITDEQAIVVENDSWKIIPD